MSTEPENLVLQLLRDMRVEMATEADIADLRSETGSLRSGMGSVASDFIDVRREIAGVRKELGEQIVGLRRAVIAYHTSVVGHGVLISELEARLRRVEQRLDLPPLHAHWNPSRTDWRRQCRVSGNFRRALARRRRPADPLSTGEKHARD